MEGQQPSGPRDRINGVGSVPGYVAGQRMYPADRNRPYSEWSPVEKLEGTDGCNGTWRICRRKIDS